MEELEKEEQQEEGKEEEQEQEEQKEEEEKQEEQEEQEEEKEEQEPKTVPYERLKEQAAQLQETKAKAEEAAARVAELERKIEDRKRIAPTKEEKDKWFEENYEKAPFDTTARIADDSALAIIDAENKKNDTIEEMVDSNPEFKPHERAVKRQLRKIGWRSEAELKERVQQACWAEVGRISKKKVDIAREKAKEEAEKKGKKLVGSTAVESTVSKSKGSGTISAEEQKFATGMGVSQKDLKETASRKDNVVE